ncbi:L domain-like protein, partial [Trichodelitschia bisporula]
DNADPFNQGKDGPSPVQLRVDAARIDGRLNISAMVLKTIPDEVLNMYDYETNKASTTMWNEVVDLVRFVAADNEIETIPDTVFPDADDPDKAPQFGGVEHLDLHGNLLFDVPVGLRRLEHLTTLNLSRNRLMNDALETIAQISSLRELRMGDNLLTGELASSIETLTNLEVLDVQGNKLSRLPDELGLLTRLRVLNVSNNRLTELPMLALSKLPLVEILASKNAISGTLFPPEATGMPRLQTLDVSVNQLRAFCGSAFAVDLPTLKTLNIAFNSIAALPGLAGWTALITILAEDNKFAFLPDGFTEAHSLRNVDFTGNNFVRLDEHIGLMESLEGFKIAANPLRERKFLTMSTEELKHDLRARLAPPSHVDD